ncbi:hypothetical protein EON66_07995, partial [archaeon]
SWMMRLAWARCVQLWATATGCASCGRARILDVYGCGKKRCARHCVQAASAMSGMLKEFSSALPGIDEMMSFVELVKHIDKMEFDLTIFDTAPTGHTLRLLGMPAMLDKAISKLSSFRDRLDGIMSMVRPMLGAMAEGLSPEDLFAKLDGVKRTLRACARACVCMLRARVPTTCVLRVAREHGGMHVCRPGGQCAEAPHEP